MRMNGATNIGPSSEWSAKGLDDLDEVETMLCESKEGRLLTKVDVFVKGQALFRLDDEGIPWIKEYGEYFWSRVKIRYRN